MVSSPTFRQSHHAQRALTLPRPRWRGRLHKAALALTVPAGILTVATATPGTPRTASLVFVLGVVTMFGASSLYHWRPWSPHTTEVLLRVDHSGIYVVISTTIIAFALLGLPPDTARIAIWIAVAAATVGIVTEWLPFASPRGFNNAIYLVLGWGSLVSVPELLRRNGVIAVALLLLGGLIYTVGVVIVGRQRPDPNPEVFGYHEIWHALVIAATAVHWVDVAAVLQ